MVDKSDDAEESSPVRPDDATKVIRAKAERLDVRGEAGELAKTGGTPPETEVLALRNKVRQQRTALLTAGALLVVLLVVLFVVVVSTPSGRSEGSGSTSTTATTTTTTTSSSTPRAEPTTTTTTTTTESVTTPAPSTSVVSAENAPPRTAAPPVHLNGQDYIRSGNTYDLDNGNEFGGDGDIVHDGEAVSGTNGALLAPGKTGPDEYSRCDPALLGDSWRSHILFSGLPAGSVLCVWTTEGRASYLEITGVPNSNGGNNMSFRWTTWQK